jgi:hypothetical protein
VVQAWVVPKTGDVTAIQFCAKLPDMNPLSLRRHVRFDKIEEKETKP